jgi:hypothetical protein
MLIGGALMIDPASTSQGKLAVASLWSYAEADPTILGIGVVVLTVAAFAFVGSRVLAHVRRRR